jgi:PAS domain S-box-containing protein
MGERIHPEDRERTVKAFEEAKASDRNSHSEEYRFYTENEGLINVFGRTQIERNTEGKAVRLIGSMMDITDSKRAEEELIKSKQQFQSLVENISGVYWVNDLETYQTLYISPSYETVWGRKCEDLYNNPADFINAVHPEDRPLLIAAHKNIGDTTVMNIEYRIIRPGGDIRWISAKTYVVVTADQKKIEYGYAEDVTERKNAEEALQHTEKRLQFLLSATPAVIYSCKAEFPFAATFVSENIMEQSGYTAEEFIKVPNFWADNIHPDDRDDVLTELMQLFEKGHHTHEYRFRLKDSAIYGYMTN